MAHRVGHGFGDEPVGSNVDGGGEFVQVDYVRVHRHVRCRHARREFPHRRRESEFVERGRSQFVHQ
jgi:hypothetical protein